MARRRLIAAVVAGAIALAGLSACRVDAGSAAYVGDSRLTDAQVEKIVDEFPAATQQKFAGQIRHLVVVDFVAREIGTRLAKEHGITVKAPDVGQFANDARQMGVPQNGKFITLSAQAIAVQEAIAGLGTAQAPTEADKQEVFAQLVADRVVQGNAYDAVKDKIDSPQLRSALGLRPIMADALDRFDVSVNPRYRPLGIPIQFTLGQLTLAIQLPVNPESDPAVVDVSPTPAA